MSKKIIPKYNAKAETLMKSNDIISKIQELNYNLYKDMYNGLYPEKNHEEIKNMISIDNKDQIENSVKALSGGIKIKGIENALEINNSLIIQGRRSNNFNEQLKRKELYSSKIDKFKPFFRDYLLSDSVTTGKTNTPHQLLSQTLDVSSKMHYEFIGKKSMMSKEHAMKAINTIKNENDFVLFDYETLAGQNSDGYSTFRGITEFAFGDYSKKTEGTGLEQNNVYSSIVGVSKETSEELLKRYEQALKKGDKISDELSVAMKAFGKMGHSSTQIAEDSNLKSIYNFTSYASDDDVGITNIDNIKRGIEIYDNIHRQQQTTLGESGAPIVEEQFVKGVKLLQERPSVGYNTMKADIPWTNQQLQMLSQQGQAYAKEQLGSLEINPTEENTIDILGLIDVREQLGGSTLDFYDSDVNNLERTRGGRKTYRSQSSVVGNILRNKKYQELYGVGTDDLTAHSAVDDIEMLARVTSVTEVMDALTGDIEKASGNTSKIGLDIENQAFLNTETSSFGKYHSGGPLSFTYDPETNTVKTFSGHNLLGKDKTRVEFNDYGRKKDTVVKINSIREIKPNEDFIKQAMDLDPSYAQETLYTMELSTITNLKDSKTANKNTVMVFKSQEEMQNYVNNMILVGEKDEDGNYQLPKNRELINEKLSRFSSADNRVITDENAYDNLYNTLDGDRVKLAKNGPSKVVSKNIESFEEIVSYSDERYSEDLAGDVVNNLTYGKAKGFQKVYNRIQGLSNSEDVNPELARQYMYGTNPEQASIDRAELTDMLGFFDRINNKQVLYDETIDKMAYSWDSLKSMSAISDPIVNYLDSLDISQAEKSKRFKYIYGQAQSEIINRISSNPETAQLLMGKRKKDSYAKDLNYMDFNIKGVLSSSDNYTYDSSSPLVQKNSDYISLNLDKGGEYRFVEDLLRASGESSKAKPYNRDKKALVAIDKFIGSIRQNEEYESIDFKRYYDKDGSLKFKNPEVMSKMLIEDFSKLKKSKNDPMYGIHELKETTGPLLDGVNAQVINAAIRTNFKSMEDMIANIDKNMPRIINPSDMTPEQIKVTAQGMAERSLLPKGGVKELTDHLEEYGHDKEGIEFIKGNIDKTVESLTDTYAAMISRGSSIGLNIMADKDGQVILNYNDSYIPLDNIPKLEALDGTVVANVGNVRTSLQSIVKSKGLGEYDSGERSMYTTTTVGAAIDETFNPAYSFHKNKDDPDKIIASIEYFNKKIGESVRESSPALTENTIAERRQMWEVDFKEIIGQFKHFDEMGVFDETKWADENFRKYVLDNEKFDADSLMGSDREMLAKNIAIAFESIRGAIETNKIPKVYGEDQGFVSLLQNFSTLSPEKSLSENIGMFGHSGDLAGLTRGDRSQRPVPYQAGGSKEFRQSYLRDKIESWGKQADGIVLGSRIITDSYDIFQNKNVKGLSEGLERSVLIKKSNMSTKDLRTVIADRISSEAEIYNKDTIRERLAKDANYKFEAETLEEYVGSESAQKLKKILALETFEDGLIAGPVLFDMFGKSQQQEINLTKEFRIDTGNDLQDKRTIDKLSRLMPKMTRDKDGTVKVEYGDGEIFDKEENFLEVAGYGEEAVKAYGSKFKKGRLTFEYKSKTGNEKATEEEIQDYVNNVLLVEKPDLTMSEIQNELSKVYDFKAVMTNLERQTYFKGFMDTPEKGMVGAPVFAVGEFDKRVDAYFENSNDPTIKGLKGLVFDLDYFDEVIGNRFKPSEEFKTKEELKDAMLKEQIAPMIELFGDGEEAGILGMTGVQLVGPTGSPKHQNLFTDFERSVNLLVKDVMEKEGLDENDATAFVMSEMQDRDIFLIDGAFYKDGKIVVPSKPSSLQNAIEGKSFDALDRGKMKDFLRERGLVQTIQEKDEEGNLVVREFFGEIDPRTGTTLSYTSFGKAIDFDRASYSKMRDVDNAAIESIKSQKENLIEDQRRNKGRIRSLQNRLENDALRPSEIDSIKKSIESITGEMDLIQKQIEDTDYQYRQAKGAQEFFNRPAKIGNRELFLLGLNRANEGSVNAFQEEIDSGRMDAQTARDTLSHMFNLEETEDGLKVTGVNERYKNESMLKENIETLKARMFNKYGGETLDEALERDPEKYSHLAKLSGVLQERGIVADLRSAEELSQVSNTYKALLFNAEDKKRIEDIEEKGFQRIDIMDMFVPGNEDVDETKRNFKTYLTDNLVADFGEEFGDDRYLAIPHLERTSGDSVIKFEHQKALGALQNAYYEYDQARETGTDADIEIKKANVLSKISDFKSDMSKDLTKKKALMAQASEIYLDSAYMGKTSSIVNIDLNRILAEDNREYTSEVEKKLAEGNIKLNRGVLNFSDLNVATFNGKTLMEHAEEGNHIAASFLSKEAFEDMGYFDDGYVKQYAQAKYEAGLEEGQENLFNWDSYTKEDKDEFRDEIEHELRTEGLDAFMVRYPSIKAGSIVPTGVYMSDDLHGNMFKVTAPQQLAMEGDNDGDLIRSFIAKSRDGKDSLLAKVMGEDRDEFKEIRATRLFRAMTSDTVWQDRVEANVMKEFGNAFEEGNLLSVSGDRVLDDMIFSSAGAEKSIEGVKEMREQWDEIERDILERFDDIESAEDITYSTLDDYLEIYEKGGQERMEKRNAMIFHLNTINMQREALNKYKKLSIGEANVPLYAIRQYSQLEMGEEGIDDAAYGRLMAIQSVADEAEQAVISSKNSLEDYAEVNRTFRSAINNAIYQGESGELRDWLETNLDKEKLLEQIEVEDSKGTFAGMFEGLEAETEEELNEMKANRIMDTFAEEVSSFDSQAFKRMNYLMKQGSSLVELTEDQIQESLLAVNKSDQGTQSMVLDIMDEAFDISDNIKDQTFQESKTRGTYNNYGYFNESDFDNDYSYIDERMSLRDETTTSDIIMNSLSSIHSAVSSATENIDGTSLAVGALALAAGTMTIGALVGNPVLRNSREEEQINQNIYNDSLMDNDLDMYQTHQGGYVINLNGSTKQNSRQVQNSVAAAMSGEMPLDINISMNINDDTAELTEKYIQDMLSSYL